MAAKEVKFGEEARQRMKYLAYIDPVARDDDVNIEATETTPIPRYQMPKKIRKISRRKRGQMETEEAVPEPDNEVHVITE